MAIKKMIRILYVAFILALFWGLCNTSIAGDNPLMALRYEQYPVKNIFKGKPVVPRLEDQDAKQYRTAIRNGAKSGPNFAGEYTVVEHGCGACAKCFFIVNARTGKVYNRPFYLGCHYREGVPGYGLVGLDYRLNSKLFIVRGARNEKDGGEYYYLWEKDHLKLLKSLEEAIKYE